VREDMGRLVARQMGDPLPYSLAVQVCVVATIGFVLDLIADRASLAEESLDGYSRAGDLATHSAFWLSFMLILLPSLGRICVLTSRLAARTSHAFGALFVAKFLLIYCTSRSGLRSTSCRWSASSSTRTTGRPSSGWLSASPSSCACSLRPTTPRSCLWGYGGR